MALTSQDRQRVATGLMRYWSHIWESLAVDKAELLAAVVATDTWIEDNQASYNTALPEAFRTNATAIQKTMVFCAVATMRVSVAFARALFGEVD